MASHNRVILLGNLTRDPELRYLQSGMAVTDIGLALNDRRKNANGEWIEEVTFVDVTLWGRTAEVASEYLSK
jgi:single-strand DNA-binding protein